MGCGFVDGRLEGILLWLVVNRGKVIGTVTGILLGWLTIKYGLVKAIFVLLCLFVGYGVGARLDEREDTGTGSFFSSKRR